MPTAAPRDAVAGVVRETRVCDGDSGAGSVGGGRQCGVLVLAHGSCARRTRAGYRQARVAGGICRHKRLQQARRRQRRTGLGLDTRLVQLISANGARICGVRESRGASTRGVPGAQRRCRWARDHSWQQAGGLAGWRAGGRTGANVPRPKRHGVPVQASHTRSDAEPQAGLLPPQGANAARAGGSAAPFLHDEAGPLLAVLLHVHLLIVCHSPSVETATMRDVSVRRTASWVWSFCTRTCSRVVCEAWHTAETRESGSARAVQA